MSDAAQPLFAVEGLRARPAEGDAGGIPQGIDLTSDSVHLLVDGRIVAGGGPGPADEFETGGDEAFRARAAS